MSEYQSVGPASGVSSEIRDGVLYRCTYNVLILGTKILRHRYSRYHGSIQEFCQVKELVIYL